MLIWLWSLFGARMLVVQYIVLALSEGNGCRQAALTQAYTQGEMQLRHQAGFRKPHCYSLLCGFSFFKVNKRKAMAQRFWSTAAEAFPSSHLLTLMLPQFMWELIQNTLHRKMGQIYSAHQI